MNPVKLVSRRWIIPTILVIVGMIVLARLGIWQLDRLQQKRDHNATMAERWRMEPYDLNSSRLPADLEDLTYRRIQARGTFDYEHQIALKNQFYLNAPGAVLVTPLVMDDGRAVLIARGWVPEDQAAPAVWPQFEEDATTVLGTIAKTQPPPVAGQGWLARLVAWLGQGAQPPEQDTGFQDAWFRVDIPAIQPQMPYPLESGWIVQLPEEGRTSAQLPVREEPMTLDEGNHLGYAVQWFTFALVLGFGYIMLVRQQERRRQNSLVSPVEVTGATGAADADTSAAAAVRAPVASEDDLAPQAGQPLQKADSARQDAAPEPAAPVRHAV